MRQFLIYFLISLNTLAQVEIGENAPDFNLFSHTGENIQLSKFKGKTIVLEWYNSGCPFVRKFYDVNSMQELQKKYKDNTIWFTINSSAKEKQGHIGTSEEAKKQFEKEKMNSYALLLDGLKGEVGKKYEAKTTPHMFIINKDGKLVYDGAIDSIASTDSSDIKKADPIFENALKSTLKGEKILGSKNKSYGCSVKY